MTDNVIPIGGVTKLDLPADKVLEANIGVFESVVIMGYDKDGYEVFATSVADGGYILWLIDICSEDRICNVDFFMCSLIFHFDIKGEDFAITLDSINADTFDVYRKDTSDTFKQVFGSNITMTHCALYTEEDV